MQLSKEDYARKRIHNGSSLQIENSVNGVTVRHHSASLVMPNSYPSDGIFNQHLATIKDSYILTCSTCKEQTVTLSHVLPATGHIKDYGVVPVFTLNNQIPRLI